MKANYLQQNKQSRVIQSKATITRPVTQKIAWVGCRKLGGIFPMINLGTDHHEIYHQHILFSLNHNLPTGNHNNIGFHKRNQTNLGSLFSEANTNGYKRQFVLSTSTHEDEWLIRSIYQTPVPSTYNVLTSNCQHWVNRVINTYNGIRRNNQVNDISYMP